ncbi:Asparagine synthetase [glutamine-hydrolyzing] 1 [Flavobacterium sp. CECT 9288]|uniref:asparagine synthase (glutamine-hydrolyzing) n=1 Tax=Flavobacterium sp. CECT 9288 TaxID=2845819 RepID=UPI001E35288E|nr:asparagine synthase (glutamine-hydrolyzing) [Flavobacterium sp. CECT 9288]CAH0334860.1 Asparagine synthetase [glutamine-hydrolyzing] 1 [Flavobacterium sp. CECT 9288]
MCGIFGFLGKKYQGSREDLLVMKNSLNHRGPDHFDFSSLEINKEYSVNLGHVRLSIIDTSSAGNQPMNSQSGRFTIVFNGEIYNFLDIKKEIEERLPEILWKGSSDTEVLLAGFELFGLQECVSKLVGMFAFGLWDNELQKFCLVRDRIGEKPLYYGFQGGQFVFASELKAFEVHSNFEKVLNIDAAVGFLLRSCVPQNLSIYKNIYKVIPGTIMEFDFDIIQKQTLPEPIVYWSLVDKVKELEKNNFKGTYQEAKDKLEQLLIQAVKNQSISDVPLGAFLSGGIDSSLVCAILKKYVKSDLHTYTIAMPEPGQNESVHAEKVANSLGTIHKSKELNTDEIISRVDEIISYWDEPFADSSQIPTFFVSELAKNEVTVSLSGDGADEFVYGYSDHPIYDKYASFKIASILGVDKFFGFVMKFEPFRKIGILNRIQNFLSLTTILKNSKNLNEAHAEWRNKFRNNPLPLKNNLISFSDDFLKTKDLGFNFAGYYDALAYLPDDILVKVDRAAMAVSLESRAPFLDHRVLEFLISLPKEFKYENNISKRILKDILYDYVPKSIVDRPKQGFSIPLTFWLRNDLKDWGLKIIEQIPFDSTFWDRKLVFKIWDEHQEHKVDHTERIWNILLLESFFKRKKMLHHASEV